jgi:membrane associated rhomboid family serine protease
MQVWRYLTYAFIHGGIWHFLFNMMMLWMFGEDIALYMGNRWFWILYLFSAIFAGLFSIPFYLFSGEFAVIIGASGALMGIFVAYAKLFPDRMILLFFVIPLKIKHAMWVLIALDVFLSRSGDSIAHYTHLGGILAGFICMYFYSKGLSWNSLRGEMKHRRNRGSTSDKVLEGEVGYIDQDQQLDMILQKVSRSGVSSLSESEKNYLIRASEARKKRSRF